MELSLASLYSKDMLLCSAEADLCVSALNGYNWQGSILDVKLAGGSAPVKASTNNFGAKQAKPDASFSAKRVLSDQVNTQNKTFCKNMADSMPTIVQHDQCPDTLICGECRFVTGSVQEYVEHRKKQCTFFKADGEPAKLQCFTCTEDFSDSWSLVRHLTSTHKLVLFKEPSGNGDETATNGNAQPEQEEEQEEIEL
uniref:C2H2-type domain-containing protein n=1 Tax=Ditylenchus dipsaci TaxID=166011 RepID=A0A915EHB3_9BILA